MTMRWATVRCTMLAALLAGCAVGPDFHAPASPAVAGFTKEALPDKTESAPIAGGEAQRFTAGRDIPGEWWALFHSEPLHALIEHSLKSNPTLQSAQAALRAAMENLRAQQGFYFPTITAGFAPSRNKNAAQVSPALASSVRLYDLYQAQLNASWTLDIFGANRRQVELLRAQADAQRFQL